MPQPLSIRLDVAIVGGGFAGVYCARALERKKFQTHKRVGLISEENVMIFQPLLAEVAGSSIEPDHPVSPLRELCPKTTIIRRKVREIDLHKKQIFLQPGESSPEAIVSFDHIVLALGSDIDLSKIPGMSEHGLLMKTVADALALRARIIDRFEEASLFTDPKITHKLLRFMVVGGGYTGVETAGQILDMSRDIAKLYPAHLQNAFRVTLVHGGPRLMPTMSERLAKYAENILRKRGMEILLNTHLTSMTGSKVKFQDGRTISTSTVVAAIGNSPNPIISNLCQTYQFETEKGRIKTDRNFRVLGQTHVWAAGDCAAVPLQDGTISPALAQFAYQQAFVLGDNIIRTYKNESLRPFVYKSQGELAVLGHLNAVGQIRGIHFSGFFAWMLWRSIYLYKLPGFQRKLQVMLDWTFELFFTRDVSLIRPARTQLVQKIYLEEGDFIFEKGDVPHSSYVVQSGSIELKDEDGVVHTVHSGERIGAWEALKNLTYEFDAYATEPTMLVAMDKSSLHTLTDASTELKHWIEDLAFQQAPRSHINKVIARMPESLRQRKAKDMMTENVIALKQDMTIGQALQFMKEHVHDSYPIVDEEGRPKHEIFQRVLLRSLRDGLGNAQTPIKEIMQSNAITVLPEATAAEIIERLSRSGHRKVFVVNPRDGKLEGVVAVIDLLTRVC